MERAFVRSLERFHPLAQEEKQALQDSVSRVVELGAHEDINRQGEQSSDSPILLDGFAYRYKLFDDGRRQIVAFHVAGDFCDLDDLFTPADHHVGTLTASRFALIPHRALLALIDDFPAIGRALWRVTIRDAAILRQWLANLGRQDAYVRLTHLLCEVMVRSQEAGLSDGLSYSFPLTQAELGDALGISYVHVNRVLQRLRRERLITLQNRSVTITDWARLVEAGKFDPTYLDTGSASAEERSRGRDAAAKAHAADGTLAAAVQLHQIPRRRD